MGKMYRVVEWNGGEYQERKLPNGEYEWMEYCVLSLVLYNIYREERNGMYSESTRTLRG